MNERIRELEKQAWEFVDKTWNWANANNPSQATLFKAKFAELIVRECMELVSATKDLAIEDGWNVDEAMSTAIIDIEEHFGVER
jgi:hypothetical protein